MAAAVAAVVQTSRRRIRLDVTGWPTDGPVTVTGATASGLSWTVRSITHVSAGAMSGGDYEMPSGVPVTYTATDGTTTVTSAAVSITLPAEMLRAPTTPALDVVLQVISKPGVDYARDEVVLRPLGRRTAVVLSGALSAGAFTLRVRTRTDADLTALDALAAGSARCLLILGDSQMAWTYVAVGSIRRSPFVHYFAQPSDPDGVGRWQEWDLSCTVISQPAGDLTDPYVSLGAIKAGYATLGAVAAAFPTLLDVLKA